ncbi:glycosylphosphatidylinositol anchor attachment 1 protein isoform X3 [Amborella trichopoda]|uniref:glycosylphosphatidylinositol anchor attachment 1 protein isoform X3 n=1 Tax=Amborella trichopoda TaxID=13333 RepID=UPI0009BDBF25|nr:glycosylphosphatidylinositol anchor attachment 1 protein isoform X3 [Amborella trichopoda]|eukprot:XP_020526645.1 glycosylphosphatidylinositol anchor attachment 1 protein isoform X3 [Amborella trichopoda]
MRERDSNSLHFCNLWNKSSFKVCHFFEAPSSVFFFMAFGSKVTGSAKPTFSSQDAVTANELIKELIDWKIIRVENGMQTYKIIAKHMDETGADVYYHSFYSPKKQFHPMSFFIGAPIEDHNNHSSTRAVNSIGIITAPHGDGKEAIVLVSHYNSDKMEPSDALSVSLAYSIFCLLGRAARLAKDIVWLAADSKFGEYASVAEWLKQYHDPVFIRKKLNFHPVDGDILFLRGISEDFKHAGTMAAAIVFKVLETSQGTGTDNVNICAESSNGQMPNLDLINIVHYLAVHRHGLHVEVGKLSSLLNSLWLKVVGKFLEGVSNIAGGLNPKWRFALPVLDYVEGIAVLASSVYHQALGVPTVPHGAFRDYQIDAITLEISPRVSLNSEIACSSFLVRVGS